MAEWKKPLPPNDVEAGDTGHPSMHNQLVDAVTEVRTNVDTIELTPGPKGDTGSAGAKGDKGDKGDPGATVASGVAATPVGDGTSNDVQGVLEELDARLTALEGE